jgi:hypothetical protein
MKQLEHLQKLVSYDATGKVGPFEISLVDEHEYFAEALPIDKDAQEEYARRQQGQ